MTQSSRFITLATTTGRATDNEGRTNRSCMCAVIHRPGFRASHTARAN